MILVGSMVVTEEEVWLWLMMLLSMMLNLVILMLPLLLLLMNFITHIQMTLDGLFSIF